MLAPATRVLENAILHMKTAKVQALDSVSRLPADATWEDILYCLYVRRKIEEGIKALQEGRVIEPDEVKKLFGAK
jgi:predicted transcriptional regulator